MAWRVQEDEVRDIIDADSQHSLVPFIDTANAVTDRVLAQDSESVLSVAILKQIELYLSAHYYEHLNPLALESKTADATDIFQGQFGMGLKSTKYGQTAVELDETGFLSSLNRGRAKASMSWLGKAPSDQIDYSQRD